MVRQQKSMSSDGSSDFKCLNSFTVVKLYFVYILLCQVLMKASIAEATSGETRKNNNTNKHPENIKLLDQLALRRDSFLSNSRLMQDDIFANDPWNLEIVEYDLFEFLGNLSSKYNSTGLNVQELQSKSSLPIGNKSTDISSQNEKPPLTDVESVQKLEDSKPLFPPTTPEFSAPTTSTESTAFISGDSEIAESKWQYGIFDRFTRARSTTTTKSPDITLSVDDIRGYNSDECGLRNYAVSKEEALRNPSILEDSSVFDLDSRFVPLPPPPNRRNQAFYQVKPVPPSPAPVSPAAAPPSLKESVPPAPASTKTKFTDKYENVKEHLYEHIGRPSQIPMATFDTNQHELHRHNDGTKHESPGYSHQSTEQSSNFDESQSQGGFDELTSRRNWMEDQLNATLLNSPANVTDKATNGNNQENNRKSSDLIDRIDELTLEARVIGGSDARVGDSPWSVSLQALVSRPGTGVVEYRHFCGGTIISEYYILTAAHCLDFMVGRESRLFVAIGDLHWRLTTSSRFGRRIGVEKMVIHASYKSTAFGHDIGLIRVKEPIKPIKIAGRYVVNSVCLPEKGAEHDGDAELVGWGLFSNRNEMADSLQIADVPILPRSLCVDLYRRRTGIIQWLIGIELITDKQICAGTFGRGICQGDSGSALVYNERIANRAWRLSTNTTRAGYPSRATIIGVVAFGGIRRCSYQSLPGVYMQTSKYIDWIVPRMLP